MKTYWTISGRVDFISLRVVIQTFVNIAPVLSLHTFAYFTGKVVGVADGDTIRVLCKHELVAGAIELGRER